MSRTRSVLEAKEQHIRTLYGAVLVLLVLILLLWWGWKSAPDRLTVDIPPDLRNGSELAAGQRLPTAVYGFAYYIFQQLNRWTIDGAKDYPARIETLRAYFTPSCYQYLKGDFTRRMGAQELRGRERTISEMLGRGYSSKRIYVESNSSWVVYLDLQVMEVFKGEPVKDTFVRYPLRVVGFNADPETNPFGLALDCYAGEPQRIESESEDIKSTRKGASS